MNIWLPYDNFYASAKCLSNVHLDELINSIVLTLKAQRKVNLKENQMHWMQNPTVKLWKCSTVALMFYGIIATDQRMDRGFESPMADSFLYGYEPHIYAYASSLVVRKPTMIALQKECGLPNWFGQNKLHASHRAALLALDIAHYSKFGWPEKPALNIYYPKKENSNATQNV